MKPIGHAPSKATKKLLSKSKTKVFCVGFIIGLIASWTYIFAGGDYWLFIPLWAEIVFYPGFLVGDFWYDLFGNMNLALWVGTFTVGLFYGIILVVILFFGDLFRRKKEMPHEQ